MYFIKENDKPNKILELLNIVKLEGNKIILPVNRENIVNKKTKKIADKAVKILNQTNCNKVIISKNIKRYEDFMNYLFSNNIDIVEGKWLFEVLEYDIIKYIQEKKNLKKEDLTIAILINRITEISLYNLKKIAKEYKKVNVITNHIEIFKKVEKQILDEEGIMIAVSNNKRKSLVNAKIILNVDFPQELINKYNIYDEAIIVNIQGNIRITKKRFNGMCINDYEIKVNNKAELDEVEEKFFSVKDVYEANLYKKQPIDNIIRKLERDKVEILELEGENNSL